MIINIKNICKRLYLLSFVTHRLKLEVETLQHGIKKSKHSKMIFDNLLVLVIVNFVDIFFCSLRWFRKKKFIKVDELRF